jgi:hypothetical protein
MQTAWPQIFRTDHFRIDDPFVESHITDALAQGATLSFGGSRLRASELCPRTVVSSFRRSASLSAVAVAICEPPATRSSWSLHLLCTQRPASRRLSLPPTAAHVPYHPTDADCG